MNIYFIGVIFTFALYIVVGSIAGRKVKNQEDYYVAGRNAPTLLIVGTLTASYLSSVAFMGEVGFSYDGYLIPYLILYIIAILGYFIGGKYFGRYLRRAQALTLPGFFGDRYNSKRIQVLCGLVTVVGISCYLVAVTQAAAILMQELMGTGYLMSLIIIWIAYTSFCIYSGSKGVLITETLMFLLFTVMAVISVPYIFKEAGGWPNAITNTVLGEAKPGAFSWHGVITGAGAYMGTATDVLVWAVVLGVVWLTVISVSPWQASRYLMAKNEHVVFRAGLIAPVVLVLIVTFIHIAVTSLNAIDPGITPSERVYVVTALTKFPVWLGIVVCGGIMAAALSSCATFISLVSFSLFSDVINPFIKTDPKNNLRNSRIAMIAVGLITLVITYYQPPAVMWIAYFAATMFAASWAVVGFSSVWSKRITERGAFYGMLLGILTLLVTNLLTTFAGVSYPTLLRPEILAWIASIIGVVVGSATSKVTEDQRLFREKLFIEPEGERNPKDIKRTMLYPKIAILAGIVFMVLLYVIYYVPYSQAIAMQ